MTTKQELLDKFDAAYKEFHSEIEGLDEREFGYKWLDNRWGVREIAAHLAGWHGKLASGFERMSRGEKPVPEGEDWSDTQSYNDTFAAHAKGKKRDQVLLELNDAVSSFKAAAQRLPADRFGEGKTANKMFVGIDHFREHAEMVRAWRERQAA